LKTPGSLQDRAGSQPRRLRRWAHRPGPARLPGRRHDLARARRRGRSSRPALCCATQVPAVDRWDARQVLPRPHRLRFL